MLTLDAILRTTRQMTAFGECGTREAPDRGLALALCGKRSKASRVREDEPRDRDSREPQASAK